MFEPEIEVPRTLRFWAISLVIVLGVGGALFVAYSKWAANRSAECHASCVAKGFKSHRLVAGTENAPVTACQCQS
jgi:hypothetical protein